MTHPRTKSGQSHQLIHSDTMKKCLYILLVAATVLPFFACQNNDDETGTSNPFDVLSVSYNKERNKIVVISDLHLGNDRAYSENVHHLGRLVQFLNEVRSSTSVKELVLGGDIFDEWYVPTRTETYGSGTQADFIRKSVTANQAVFDVLNRIIREGNIKLTYIPGNHDMGFTAEQVDIALPGVNQARDSSEKYAIGTYHPDGYPQIAIEHGRRYDFFCAMTPNANEDDAPGAFMPPGYFFARIAANSFTNPTTKEASTKVPAVMLNNPGDPEQFSKHLYYTLWQTVMEHVIYVNDAFDEPIIKTNVGKYTKTYAINDILPYNAADGSIQTNLYNNLFTQSNWDERERYNNVPVMTAINQAIDGSLKTGFIDDMARVQYFENEHSDVRMVIFGHTHLPKITTHTNLKHEPCLYVNSGTWEDQKTRFNHPEVDQDTVKMHFVLIAPLSATPNTLQVGLYQYRSGKHKLMDKKELAL